MSLQWLLSVVAVIWVAALVSDNLRFLTVASAVLFPALVNIVVLGLQHFRLWNPFYPIDSSDPLHSTALLGNPDDVGVYLISVLPFALAASNVQVRHRKIFAAAAGSLLVAVWINGTITAILAATVALGAFALTVVSRKRLLAIVLAIVGCAAIPAASSEFGRVLEPPLDAASLDAASNGRVTAATAAALMARESPVLGVGPGTFGWNYFDYKLQAEALLPGLRESPVRNLNFSEVHNDFLELAAEAGIPALALTCLFVASLFRKSRATPPRSDEAAFIRILKPVGLVAVVVSCSFQFPLQLSVTSLNYALMAGLALGWSGAESP